MEQSLSELLSDAFPETTVPCLEDGDLEFENLNFDEKFEKENTEMSNKDLPTKEDRALHQETEATVLSDMKDVAQNADEVQNEREDYQIEGMSLKNTDKTAEEEYINLDRECEEESSDSDDEVEKENVVTQEKVGNLLMSCHFGANAYYDNKGDKIIAEGHFLAPEGTENPRFRNEEQGESESEEEELYFGQIPEGGNGMAVKGDGTEEDEREQEEEEVQEDSSDFECEETKIIGDNAAVQSCEQEVESPYRDVPVKGNFHFPNISEQNLQDLLAEVDSQEYVEKMKDFSGEEHQEAGEGFADYPSDFSSCEYVEGEGTNQANEYESKTLPSQERAVTDATYLGREENTDEEGDGYLYSRDLEMDADGLMSMDMTYAENDRTKLELEKHVTECDDGIKTGESDSYSSSDDEMQMTRRDEEVSDSPSPQDLDSYKKLEDTYSESSAEFSRWSISDDHQFPNNRINLADFDINVDFDLLKSDALLVENLLTTEDAGVSQHPADDINSYSVIQREDSKSSSSSTRGSLDDSFFFNTELEVSGVIEQGQLGDDEYEEERNWEQEQERIKAFYRFYDDSDGEREERQIKVQFCSDPLSQVIHYETESDRDSLSSSTDGEEDLSSAETFEETRELDNTLQMQPAFDPPCVELPESMPENKISITQTSTRKPKCSGMLKVILKMVLVILMGLLMFWLTTEQADWPSHFSFS